MNEEKEISKSLAPEEIRPGDYVAMLNVVREIFPFWCMEGQDWRSIEPIRTLWLPGGSCAPMRVVEVCLPFVLVRRTDGSHRVLDTRRVRLARVSERFGRRTFKRLKPAGSGS